jgi:hypothetical protein
MQRKIMAVLIAATLLATLAILPAAAADTQALSVDGFVVSQTCLSGDIVQINLSATSQSTSEPVTYVWFLNRDNRPDTSPSTNPNAQTFARDESFKTVRVLARNAEGNLAADTVQIVTRRCEN